MKIDRHLNLVIPISDGDKTIYVHSTPISREVFERYFLVISKTFTTIYTQGLGAMGGPRVAAMTLKKIAMDNNEWDGDTGVARGLMGEIGRLTNVILLTDAGWQPIPLDQAVKEGMLDPDIASEVENIVVFFTVASSMHLRAELPTVLKTFGALWNARVESSNCTEFANSLRTSTTAESSGVKAAASSVPS